MDVLSSQDSHLNGFYSVITDPHVLVFVYFSRSAYFLQHNLASGFTLGKMIRKRMECLLCFSLLAILPHFTACRIVTA
jgi:hypothetical protein